MSGEDELLELLGPMIIDHILDKGIVIETWSSVSVSGLEILNIESEIVIRSLDSWLRYADKVTELSS